MSIWARKSSGSVATCDFLAHHQVQTGAILRLIYVFACWAHKLTEEMTHFAPAGSQIA